jgi:plastocyanin
MSKWFVRGTATAVAVFAAVAATSAMASSQSAGLTIKAVDQGSTYVINKSVTDRMFFSPGTATIKSGQTLTFKYSGMAMDEPHTISIVRRSDLPRTNKQMGNCQICNQIAVTHIKNPHAPPGPTNDIVHWIVDKGQPGLDEPGDSVAIEGMKHMSVSIKVTAPAGTTLYYICAVHPWMQGEIKVT